MKTRISGIIFFLLAAATLFNCSYSDQSPGMEAGDGTGTGGSMARFTIVGDYLYTVDNETLDVFDISTEEKPVPKSFQNVGFGVETIFPLGDKLFLGTSTGMHIFEIEPGGNPKHISFYEHVISCDPVVSDGEYAYVTLSSGRETCWRSVNELHIIDLKNIASPKLVSQFPMENPRGLAVRNDTLWLCDDGLKIYDVSDKKNIRQLHHFAGLQAYDIILNRERALVIGETGFVQYKLENDTIRKISEIFIEK